MPVIQGIGLVGLILASTAKVILLPLLSSGGYRLAGNYLAMRNNYFMLAMVLHGWGFQTASDNLHSSGDLITASAT